MKHFSKEGHFGMNEWQFTFIDKAEKVESLRIQEVFWQYRLDTLVPNGLSEREVTLYWICVLCVYIDIKYGAQVTGFRKS